MQRKPFQLEETLQNFIQATKSSFSLVNKQHETMSKNHDAFINFLEMQIGQLSKKITALPGLSGGFTNNIIDNSKNESCKVVETGFKVITNRGEDEIVE